VTSPELEILDQPLAGYRPLDATARFPDQDRCRRGTVPAFTALGDLTHTVQEGSSPVHRGFQDWATQNGAAHVYAERRYPAAGTRERAELEGATQWAHDIFTGAAPTPKQFFDPDTGLLNLPQRYLPEQFRTPPTEAPQ